MTRHVSESGKIALRVQLLDVMGGRQLQLFWATSCLFLHGMAWTIPSGRIAVAAWALSVVFLGWWLRAPRVFTGDGPREGEAGSSPVVEVAVGSVLFLWAISTALAILGICTYGLRPAIDFRFEFLILLWLSYCLSINYLSCVLVWFLVFTVFRPPPSLPWFVNYLGAPALQILVAGTVCWLSSLVHEDDGFNLGFLIAVVCVAFLYIQCYAQHRRKRDACLDDSRPAIDPGMTSEQCRRRNLFRLLGFMPMLMVLRHPRYQIRTRKEQIDWMEYASSRCGTPNHFLRSLLAFSSMALIVMLITQSAMIGWLSGLLAVVFSENWQYWYHIWECLQEAEKAEQDAP